MVRATPMSQTKGLEHDIVIKSVFVKSDHDFLKYSTNKDNVEATGF